MVSYDYQYETSPRKLEPEVRFPRKEKKKVTNSKSKKQKNKVKAKEVKMAKTNFAVLMIVFLGCVLLLMYRSVKIRESYAGVQDLSKKVSSLEKENSQLTVQIQNNLNLNNIEGMAASSLGMQKLSSKQTVYINLDTKGYTEISQKSLTKEKKISFFQKIIDKIIDFF